MMDKKTIPNLTIRDHHVILTNLTQSEHKSQILFSFIPLSAKSLLRVKLVTGEGIEPSSLQEVHIITAFQPLKLAGQTAAILTDGGTNR